MILLSDNDLVVKLAQCDLIGEALDLLRSSAKDCSVLNTLRYSLRLNDPEKAIARYVGSVQAFERINELLDSCQVLPETPIDFDLLEHLNEIPEIASRAVSIRMGTCRSLHSRNRRQTVVPSVPGNPISSSSTSGGDASANCSPTCPPAAKSTRWPCACSMSMMAEANGRLSSINSRRRRSASMVRAACGPGER